MYTDESVKALEVLNLYVYPQYSAKFYSSEFTHPTAMTSLELRSVIKLLEMVINRDSITLKSQHNKSEKKGSVFNLSGYYYNNKRPEVLYHPPP